MIRKFWTSFWAWYERYYAFQVGLTAVLFISQLAHLYWLTTDVVLQRLTGTSFWHPNAVLRFLIILVDYLEIPALLSANLVYINELRKKWNFTSILFLVLLNSQWLHLFWITDEFVVGEFQGTAHSTVLPAWLAWIAILIDYLELPVIADTMRRFFAAIRRGGARQFLQEERTG